MLRRLLTLTPLARRLLLEATLTLLLLKVFLPIGGLHRVASPEVRLPCWLQRRGATALQLATAVRRASRYLPMHPTCLMQALAVHALLARYQLQGALYFGVYQSHDVSFLAHAWVEYNGQTLIGQLPALSQYHPLTPCEASNATAPQPASR